MRVLFLEDDGVRQSAPYLRQLGVEPVVIRTGAYDRWHEDETAGQEIEVLHLPREASNAEVLRAACSVGADAMISLALLEPECQRDALIGDFFRQALGRPAVANPPSTALLAADKLRTKEYLAANGVEVVAGTAVNDLGEASAAAEKLGYPVVLKLNDGWAGRGMRLIDNARGLERFYRRDPDTMLMEAFHEGLEVSVNVLRWNGETSPQAVIYKGATDRDLSRHPIYRPQLAPPPGVGLRANEIRDVACRVTDLLGVVGTAECDLIIDAERGPLLLEVNPRIAGTQRLSAAATGVDVHLQLADMALERCDLGNVEMDPHWAAQVPVRTPLEPALCERLEAYPQVRFIKLIDWAPHLNITGCLTVRERSAEALLRFLEGLSSAPDVAGEHRRVDFGPSLDELKSLIANVSQGVAA